MREEKTEVTLREEGKYRVAWVLQRVLGAEVEGRQLEGKDRLRPDMGLRLQDRSLGPSSCRSPSPVSRESETNRYHSFYFVFSLKFLIITLQCLANATNLIINKRLSKPFCTFRLAGILDLLFLLHTENTVLSVGGGGRVFFV